MTTTPTSSSERAARARHDYSSYQIALHWTVVALVVVNWLLGQRMEDIFEARMEGQAVPSPWPAYLHIAVGVTILLVMIARLRERIRRPVQTAPESRHRTMAFLGRLNHWAFYVILLAMPPVGAIAWFGGSEAAGAIHSFVSWVLVALILLHVGGALLHLLLGEPVIRRMFRPSAES